MLRALAAGASHRALATEAGVHHSTMAVRLQDLPAGSAMTLRRRPDARDWTSR